MNKNEVVQMLLSTSDYFACLGNETKKEELRQIAESIENEINVNEMLEVEFMQLKDKIANLRKAHDGYTANKYCREYLAKQKEYDSLSRQVAQVEKFRSMIV